MNLKFTRNVLIVPTMCLILAGCSSWLEVGEPPTVCSMADDKGIKCTSAREVWGLSNDMSKLEAAKTKQYRADTENSEGEGDNSEGKTVKKEIIYPGGTPTERKNIYNDIQSNLNTLAAPEPIAVREKAKILRVLMNSWEDNSGRLHMPGYTYVEIEKRRWVIGRGATRNVSRITPLSIRKNSLTEERAHNPVGDNGMGIILPRKVNN